MFKGKDFGFVILGIGFSILGTICGFVVKQARSSKQEAISPNIADNPSTTSRKRLQQIYNAEIGVREATGKNDGLRIQQYLQVVGLHGDYSYCSAFISWIFSKAGMAEPRTAWSPALFPDKRVIWARIGGGATPQTGDVFGIYFQELRRVGHCGFVDEWKDTWCITVEANTSDAGAIASANGAGNPIRAGPGEGVYRKKRLIKTIFKVADWVSSSNN